MVSVVFVCSPADICTPMQYSHTHMITLQIRLVFSVINIYAELKCLKDRRKIDGISILGGNRLSAVQFCPIVVSPFRLVRRSAITEETVRLSSE